MLGFRGGKGFTYGISIACAVTMICVVEGNGSASAASETRPCVTNFTMQGTFMSGRTVKGFQEYPTSSRAPTFAYLTKKLLSIGYKLNSYDKELGIISASYGAGLGLGTTVDMSVSVDDRKPSGVRVELVFTAPGGVAFDKDEAQKEFCAILDGVPQ